VISLSEPLLSYQAVSLLPLPFSKPISSHRTLRTGSASEWFTPLVTLQMVKYNKKNNTMITNNQKRELILPFKLAE